MRRFRLNSMNARVLSILICLFIATGMQAAQRSVSEAKALAAQFTNKAVSGSMMRKAKASSTLNIAYTEKSAAGDANCLYVFNRGAGDGYVIVSGDDHALPVLGYADSGTFDPANIPDGLKFMMEGYAKEVQWASSRKDIPAVTATATNKYTTAVAPLLGDIAWNQDAPYSNLCPTKYGEHCVTGCVATAMAQIMRYHKWPEKGTGSYSYQWNDTTLSADFSQSTYYWANMTPTYSDSSTEAENAAVAQLMYDCGVSLDMEYDIAINGGSGAYYYKIPLALEKYFGYNPTAEFIQHAYYSASAWDSIIKAELDASRPVELSGATITNDGHAFVCDGYNQQGYFHINWGWGGVSNGYFIMSALDPTTQGVGGSTSGYFNYLGAVIGIETPKEQPNPKERTNKVAFGRPLYLYSNDTVFNQNDSIPFYIASYSYSNMGTKTFTGDLGLGVYNAKGELVKSFTVFTKETLNSYNYEKKDTLTKCIFSDVPDGSYQLWPIFKPDGGEWTRTLYQTDNIPEMNVVIADGKISLSDVSGNWKLSASVSSMTSLYSNRSFKVDATVTNKGKDFAGDIYVGLAPKSNPEKVFYPNFRYATLSQGDSLEFSIVGSLSGISAGDYYLSLVETNGNVLYQAGVTIKPEPSAYQLSIGNATIVKKDIDSLKMNVQVSNTGGYFFGNIIGAVFHKGETNVMNYVAAGQHFAVIDSATVETITPTFNISKLEPGDYQVMFATMNPAISVIYGRSFVTFFTVPDATGIANASAEELESNAPYYNLQGMRVAAPTRKGVYIHAGKKLIK